MCVSQSSAPYHFLPFIHSQWHDHNFLNLISIRILTLISHTSTFMLPSSAFYLAHLLYGHASVYSFNWSFVREGFSNRMWFKQRQQRVKKQAMWKLQQNTAGGWGGTRNSQRQARAWCASGQLGQWRKDQRHNQAPDPVSSCRPWEEPCIQLSVRKNGLMTLRCRHHSAYCKDRL